MRFLLGLIALALIVGIVLLWTGMLTLGGSLGSLKVAATAPDISANMATVTVGTENKMVQVPKLELKRGAPAAAGTATPQ